ncbi:MAG TPA: hypothetical protein VFZ09_11495 [Archangium sp.]|uniref:hypothetical protein n=1 Tax=Archangium sp. TaxID=1872627 RepID=UPI002E35B850|nr:hypothetical protein [Archangium sp.]HEX5746858.1 hypothetical protein [Archangium sp.]
MTIFELLSNAGMLVANRWRATRTREEESLYRLIQEANFYIWRTGQVYRFEDYLGRAAADRPPAEASDWSGEYSERLTQAREILSRIRDSQQSPSDQHLVQIAIDELEFIRSTGQQDDFYDYLETFYGNPPPVIARFDTRQEAEAWLNNLAEPPSSAHVLVGDDYLELFYFRDRAVRGFERQYTLERFIEAVTSRGFPPPAAVFATRAEAEAWWANQPAPPIWVFVQIAGEHYIAIHHRRIAHSTLHPISILKGWEQEKKRIEEREKEQQAEGSTSDRDE